MKIMLIKYHWIHTIMTPLLSEPIGDNLNLDFCHKALFA